MDAARHSAPMECRRVVARESKTDAAENFFR
jgi:hypothetical protein